MGQVFPVGKLSQKVCVLFKTILKKNWKEFLKIKLTSKVKKYKKQKNISYETTKINKDYEEYKKIVLYKKENRKVDEKVVNKFKERIQIIKEITCEFNLFDEVRTVINPFKNNK